MAVYPKTLAPSYFCSFLVHKFPISELNSSHSFVYFFIDMSTWCPLFKGWKETPIMRVSPCCCGHLKLLPHPRKGEYRICQSLIGNDLPDISHPVQMYRLEMQEGA